MNELYRCPKCGSPLKKTKNGYLYCWKHCLNNCFLENDIETAKKERRVIVLRDDEIPYEAYIMRKIGKTPNLKSISAWFFKSKRVMFQSSAYGYFGPYNLKDIESINVKENNTVICKADHGVISTLAGGVLFGPLGAVAGALSNDTKKEYLKKTKYSIEVTISDMYFPGFVIENVLPDTVHRFIQEINLLKD